MLLDLFAEADSLGQQVFVGIDQGDACLDVEPPLAVGGVVAKVVAVFLEPAVTLGAALEVEAGGGADGGGPAFVEGEVELVAWSAITASCF